MLDTLNATLGNLSLSDTETLLKIANLIENNEISNAYAELLEFIAQRGYNENPIEKGNLEWLSKH